MPNCDFYGALEDHRVLLDAIFETNECEIYELASDFGKPLTKFAGTDQVLAQFDRHYPSGEPWHSVHLQLVHLNAGTVFKPRRISLDPKSCDGFKFRYEASGFGLIQLYLEVPQDGDLQNSHTNHASAKREARTAACHRTKAEFELCDFDKITKYSSKLNRIIKKLAVGTLARRPVLPAAFELWKQGVKLGAYSQSSSSIDFK